MNIKLGGIGDVEISPNSEDIQIAHSIWVDLVTRKAAIPIDPDHDVIVEVYDSWYTLFASIRNQIANIPADLVRRENSTKKLVQISIQTINVGLRPHLTHWQARFRAWWKAHEGELEKITPQELQKKYPQYDEMISDMLRVNAQLVEYANALESLREGNE